MAVSPPRLVLASASPRRVELLAGVGVEVDVRPGEIDESPQPGESAAAMVRRLAETKADAAAAELCGVGEPWIVLAGDTTVLADGEILGKPVDDTDARRMLGRLSGRSHHVVGGVAVIDHAGTRASAVEVTTVWFRPLSATDIAWYVDTGEAAGKAGGYGIQGAASLFVERIEGSYANVVGLPLVAVDRLLSDLGHPLRTYAGAQS